MFKITIKKGMRMLSINSGFTNEKKLVNALNNKKFKEIEQKHLQLFVKYIFPFVTKDTKIKCSLADKSEVTINEKRKSINPKQDIIISVNGKDMYISIKEGDGNSVHQEPLETFVTFLINELAAPTEVIDSLKKFHWGDGTLDGSAPKEKRMKGAEITKYFSSDMEIVQDFFMKHKKVLLERILIKGAYAEVESRVDYFYHGNIENGVWCDAKYAIDINLRTENEKKPISVGLLNFQNQNRNTTNNPNKEEARKSIQFKWSGMRNIIDKHMPMSVRLNSRLNKKKRGDNSHGFLNKETIMNALNGQSFENIKQENLKSFVKDIFPDITQKTIITCEKVVNKTEKGSFDICAGKQTHRILIKSGSNNSVHQESFELFYDFLKKELYASDQIIEDFKIFQWGDGTLDGKTSKEKWLKINDIKKKFSSQYLRVQKYINQPEIAEKLLTRFLLTGTSNSGNRVDYYYFGNADTGNWAKAKDILDYELNHLSKNILKPGSLNIGTTGLQTWGRTMKGTRDMRTQLQLKASKLEKVIKLVGKCASYKEQGDISERDFVRRINQNDQKLIAAFGKLEGNIYAVNVSTKQFSKIADKKVMPKSDAYLISVNETIDEDLLYENSYVLSEDDVKDIAHKKIHQTGVSIKRKDSRSFTYLKTTKNSFNRLFKDEGKLFAPTLFFVREDREIIKNEEILNSVGVQLNEISHSLEIPIIEDKKLMYSQMKEKSMEKVQMIIKDKPSLYDAVFFGKDIFEEPYCATYFYQNDLIHKDNMRNIKFSITSGSGRSKGNYTVVIKPK